MKRCAGPQCDHLLGDRTDRKRGIVKHYGRGLCMDCYGQALRTDELADYPRIMRSADEMLDEWDRLRRAGVLRAEAAERIGVRLETLERMLYRHRDDPRAQLGQRRELYFRKRDETTGRWVA